MLEAVLHSNFTTTFTTTFEMKSFFCKNMTVTQFWEITLKIWLIYAVYKGFI